MAIPITVPRQGWSMEEGTFVEWLKRDGDPVQPGDALFVLESDKSAESIEAIDAGILRIPADGPAPGSVVKVGQVLAFLAAEGEQVQETGIRSQESGVRSQGSGVRNKVAASSPKASLRALGVQRSQRAVTPRARRAARELNIDVGQLVGTGRDGRIRERDVRGSSKPQTGRLIPHTPTRRTIAARMVAGVTQTAPVTLTTKADATQLVARRRGMQATANAVVPSYTDFILKLTATVLRHHPLLRAQWRDDGLFIPEAIDVAVAVDAEAGLLAPVLRGVDRSSLTEIATQTAALIADARAGRLTAEHLRGAVFTVTNLGMHGVDAFTPIITLPQCAVLGVGRIVREPVVVGEQIVPREQITLSLTFDHRVVDGAPAARFLNDVRRALEVASVEA